MLANSADPDEMQQYAAFHLGLHCLLQCTFSGFEYAKGKVSICTLLSGTRKIFSK